MARVLIINGSPRGGGNSQILADRVTAGAIAVADTEARQFAFAGKRFEGCRAECSKYCMEHGACCVQDGMQELWDAFVWADGIAWVVPVYHVGPPGQVKCAMDRLCNMQYSYFQGKYPRWNKAWGAVAQGSTRYGGQEFTLQWLIESALLMKCLPIAADAPKSYFGVAGYAPTWEKGCIETDSEALLLSENMGRRVAETAQVIQNGIQSMDGLDLCWYPQRCMEKRSQTAVAITDKWQSGI